MPFLKQGEVEETKRKKREPKKKRDATNDPITGYERICEMQRREPTDLGGIEYALESLADHVGSYVNNAASGNNNLAVFTGPEGSGYHPVLIALDPTSETTEDLLEVLGRVATAFERIADAMTGTHKADPTV